MMNDGKREGVSVTGEVKTDDVSVTDNIKSDGMIETDGVKTENVVAVDNIKTDDAIKTGNIKSDGAIKTDDIKTDNVKTNDRGEIDNVRSDGMYATDNIISDDTSVSDSASEGKSIDVKCAHEGEEDTEYKEVSGEDMSRKEREAYIQRRLDKVTDSLIKKLERAIEELDEYNVRVTVKEKRIEYDEEGKKPLYERVTEREETERIKGMIDRGALKQLASALKELKGKEEEISESEGIVVVLNDDTRELAQ